MLTSAPQANIPLQLKPCHVIKIIRILKNRDLHFKYFGSSYDSITKNQI